MKVLILSCDTGGGHNAASAALREAFERAGHTAVVKDSMSFVNKRIGEKVGPAYVGLVLKWPAAFGATYKAADKISSKNFRSPVYYANALYSSRLADYINISGFDAVMCPHLYPAEALTRLIRKKRIKARCFGVATDYACTPFWEETRMFRYFLPHKDIIPVYADKGVSEDILIPTGIPVSSRFTVKTDKAEARKELGLPEDKNLYLVMTGSMGFKKGDSMIAGILENDPRAFVVVLTGSSESLKESLAATYPADKVLPLGYTKKVSLYMDACDVLLSKPGGLSSTEAAAKGVPLVHTSPIPGCETVNAEFFESHGMSVKTDSPVSAALAAVFLATDKKAAEKLVAAQKREINARAADDIVKKVSELLSEET